jgi:hypothetical protein
VKRRRLDRLNLTDEKNENISQIFNEYQKLVWKWNDISITDENSCKSVLSEFNLTDLDEQSTTKWDHLRDVISDNIDLNLISPSVVQQTLWEDYLKKEIITVKIEKDDTTIKKEFEFKDIEILKNTKRKDVKAEEGVDEKELKSLEEGFKRTDDI